MESLRDVVPSLAHSTPGRGIVVTSNLSLNESLHFRPALVYITRSSQSHISTPIRYMPASAGLARHFLHAGGSGLKLETLSSKQTPDPKRRCERLKQRMLFPSVEIELQLNSWPGRWIKDGDFQSPIYVEKLALSV